MLNHGQHATGQWAQLKSVLSCLGIALFILKLTPLDPSYLNNAYEFSLVKVQP